MSELSDYYAKRFKPHYKKDIKIHLLRPSDGEDVFITPCGRDTEEVRTSSDLDRVTCLICKRVK